MNKKIIVVLVEGGLVTEISGVPEGYELRVEDYDAADTSHPSWDADKQCSITAYTGGKRRCLRSS
jgi:hypothetical protein